MSQEKDALDVTSFSDRLGIMSVSLLQARKIIELCFESGHVPCLIGDAGTGKTQLFHQIACEKAWQIHCHYLSHVEREDIGGIPYPNLEEGWYSFLGEDSIMKLVTTETPTILLFDEWNRGERPVMNAAFTVMEQRRFGSQVLPGHVFPAASMNPSEGSYLVNEAEKDPAFRRRLCFIGVRTDPATFLSYATSDGKFHKLVTDFITTQPQCLMDSATREAGKIYANPASWEKVSQTLQAVEKMGHDVLEMIDLLRVKFSGHVGIGVATEFTEWIRNKAIGVSPQDVLEDFSAAAKDIQKLIGDGRSDAIAKLSDGIALTISTNRPEPKKVVDPLCEYGALLPADAASAFIVKLHRAMAAIEKQEYMTTLSEVMSEHPKFADVILRVNEAPNRINRALSEGSGEVDNEDED